MQDATRQLRQVRRRARGWLALIHILRFTAVMVLVVLLLGVVDWALNLPGWLRLVIGLLICAECVYWLSSRLSAALKFNPSLGELALRAERMYPELTGVLASSVEFAAGPSAGHGDTETVHARALTELALSRARGLTETLDLSRLIDPSSAMKRLVVAVLAIVVLGTIVGTAPAMSRLAASRWLMPLGATQWPRSVVIQDTTGLDVCPVDAPVRFMSQIERGHYDGMRVNVYYRFTDALGQVGQWGRAVLTQQSTDTVTDGAATYEQLLEVPVSVARSVNDTPGGEAVLRYYFQAGDGQTTASEVMLIARPAVVAVHADIQPPVYAVGLTASQDVSMHEQGGQVASATALIGSRVRLRIDWNKPIEIRREQLESVLPGLIPAIALEGVSIETVSDPDRATNDHLLVSFDLTDSLSTTIQVSDDHGLENLSRRQYRIEAVEDRLPTAAMTEPSADEAVLATAVIDIAATAQDDVGLERIVLDGSIKTQPAGQDPTETTLPTLAENSGRQTSLRAQSDLDLSKLDLRPGDSVVLTASAQDVFDLNGQRHDPVTSAPRTLRIIDEPTLTAQMRTELAGLRQQVVRLEQTQERIASEQPPSITQPQQEQVTRRLESQTQLLDELRDRMRRNRLEDQPMQEVIQQADTLVQQARTSSSDAADKLRRSSEQTSEQQDEAERLEQAAHEDQKEVRQTLNELAELLDQGRDVLTLKLQLQQLQTQQQSIANDTRELLPETIGQDRDQLDESQQERLDELEQRQAELSEQAQALTRQMQVTAEALSQQGERDQDKAAAEALAEAAAIGQRQGLSQSMQQSSESIQENRLSQSGQQQDQALDALEQMLDEMGTQEKRRQAILKRRLQELTELVRKLLQRQTAQALLLEQSLEGEVAALEPDQVTLRRATMGAQQQAGGSEESSEVALRLADAVREQGVAVGALRQGDGKTALTMERNAVEHLQAALDELNKIVDDNATQQARKEREALRQAYEQHAKRQGEIRNSVRQITDAGPVNRQRRAALITLSGEQSDLQLAIAETGKLVEQTLVFLHLHEQVGGTSSRVVHALRRGDGTGPVLDDQQMIATSLQTMAEALKEDPSDEEFSGGGGDGGGGGGGGGPEPPLIAPVAELKLIRGIQALVYEQTRSMDSGLAEQPDEPIKQKMLELSTRQRELSGLGKRLIEKMKEQNTPALPAPPPPTDEEDTP